MCIYLIVLSVQTGLVIVAGIPGVEMLLPLSAS